MSAQEAAYGPSWYAATGIAAPERGALTFDLDVDVCVIGGGLAGLTVAREVARRGWSVAVLEARRIAWNASGRNGGFVGPGFAEHPERIIERVGLQRAKELWALSCAGVEYMRDAIRTTGMPGVDPVDGWLYVQRVHDPEGLADSADLVGGAFATEVELWPTDKVRAMLKSPIYFQGLHLPRGFHIHPLNYARGLAADAEAAGARIFEETRALAIDPAGVRKRVDAGQGRVRAAHIVLAGSAHLAPLHPFVSDAVLPVSTHVAVTEPLGDRLAEAVTYRGAVVDTRRASDYFRIVDGTRLLWGGGITTRFATPSAVTRQLRRRIRKAFPQLGRVSFAHVWSGVMGYSVHKMPQIGEVAPGLWVASAFGGHGLNTTAMAGQLIARAIIDGDDTWRCFESYDLVWAGGRFGRAAAQASYWWMQAQDAVSERVARLRDRKRRRRESIVARATEEARRTIAVEQQRVATDWAERRAAAQAADRAAQEAKRRADADEARRRAAELAQEMQARRAESLEAGEAAQLAAEEAARAAAEATRLAAVEAERKAVEAAALRAADIEPAAPTEPVERDAGAGGKGEVASADAVLSDHMPLEPTTAATSPAAEERPPAEAQPVQRAMAAEESSILAPTAAGESEPVAPAALAVPAEPTAFPEPAAPAELATSPEPAAPAEPASKRPARVRKNRRPASEEALRLVAETNRRVAAVDGPPPVQPSVDRDAARLSDEMAQGLAMQAAKAAEHPERNATDDASSRAEEAAFRLVEETARLADEALLKAAEEASRSERNPAHDAAFKDAQERVEDTIAQPSTVRTKRPPSRRARRAGETDADTDGRRRRRPSPVESPSE